MRFLFLAFIVLLIFWVTPSMSYMDGQDSQEDPKPKVATTTMKAKEVTTMPMPVTDQPPAPAPAPKDPIKTPDTVRALCNSLGFF